MSRGEGRAPTRRQHFAARGREQRELERRRSTADTIDPAEARQRLLEHLNAARLAALQCRMVMVGAEISSLILAIERRP